MSTRSEVDDVQDVQLERIEQLIRNTPMAIDLTEPTMERYKNSNGSSGARHDKRQKITAIIASAAAFFIIVISGSFVSPTMAASIKHGLASIFNLSDDLGLKSAEDNGLVTHLEAKDTHQGLTLKVPLVTYDGSRVAIGLEQEQGQEQEQQQAAFGGTDSEDGIINRISDIDLFIDGKSIQTFAPDSSNSIGILQYPGKDNNSSIMEFSDLHNQGGKAFPSNFNLGLNIKVSGIEEPFRIHIPVERNTGSFLVLQPSVSKHYKNFDFTIDKIELSPLTTTITTHLRLLGDAEFDVPTRSMGIDVFDEKGNIFNLLSGNGWNATGGTELVTEYRFNPFPSTPQKIIIKPYFMRFKQDKTSFQLDEDGYPIVDYIPELEVTLLCPPESR
ncbi:hypothetical protein AWM70_21615 [Paenibacillus yonginensis]|uniref:DUF4179 domain-containing protein n=1 Tax=Paenibacillus yonginensis TaxID=1462996 RepID=A0A1B1N615_9BACL|nr:DUF4179 domain-containing protein [Paenibacillus yonginensis]ANS76859.1 hypothetical protein AWM70_21615 [Paenibacillus yonginensis]